MANIGGPKGPKDALPGKVLQFPRVERKDIKVELPEIKAETPPSVTEQFDGTAANTGTVLPEGPAPDAKGAQVRARLAQMGQLPIKKSEVGRVKDTPLGKIFEGSLKVESAAGLKKLEGVVRVTGDLVIQESVAKSPDFLALKSLIEVGGRLTIEGNGAVGVLDALENLERAKGIYVGFNAALTRISLPKLKELDAALIVEHNPHLTEINLPSFAKGGLYLHVHENASLVTVLLPSLSALEDELSLLNNPKLRDVKVGAKDKPAKVPVVEIAGNAAPQFTQLFAKA